MNLVYHDTVILVYTINVAIYICHFCILRHHHLIWKAIAMALQLATAIIYQALKYEGNLLPLIQLLTLTIMYIITEMFHYIYVDMLSCNSCSWELASPAIDNLAFGGRGPGTYP